MFPVTLSCDKNIGKQNLFPKILTIHFSVHLLQAFLSPKYPYGFLLNIYIPKALRTFRFSHPAMKFSVMGNRMRLQKNDIFLPPGDRDRFSSIYYQERSFFRR